MTASGCSPPAGKYKSNPHHNLIPGDISERFACGCSDRMIKYWELAKFTCLRTLKDTAQVNSCAFFPRRVRSSSDVSVPLAVTCSNDSTTIWDLVTIHAIPTTTRCPGTSLTDCLCSQTSGEAVRKLYGHDSVMTCALFGALSALSFLQSWPLFRVFL